MRKLSLQFVLLILVMLLTGTRSLQATPGILMPQEVFVGDTAEFSFGTASLNSVIADGILFTVPSEGLPSSYELTVESIVVFRNGNSETVTIRFVPWISGVLQIPAFEIKKLKITPPPVRIASLVEKTGKNTLERARSPLLVPGTTWLLYAVIAAVIAAIAAGSYACLKLYRYFVETPGKRLAGKRVRLFLREMRILEREIKRISIPIWYASFAASLRRYFGAFCTGNLESFLALTGPEIVCCVREKLGESAVPGAGSGAPAGEHDALADRAADLFSSVDHVRFSGAGEGDRRADDLAVAQNLVADLEALLVVLANREDAYAQS